MLRAETAIPEERDREFKRLRGEIANLPNISEHLANEVSRPGVGEPQAAGRARQAIGCSGAAPLTPSLQRLQTPSPISTESLATFVSRPLSQLLSCLVPLVNLRASRVDAQSA